MKHLFFIIVALAALLFGLSVVLLSFATSANAQPQPPIIAGPCAVGSPASWFKASPENVTYFDGALSWRNLGSNGSPAVQVDGDFAPVLVANDNCGHALRFDGLDDFIPLPVRFSTQESDPGPATIFIVKKNRSDTQGKTTLLGAIEDVSTCPGKTFVDLSGFSLYANSDSLLKCMEAGAFHGRSGSIFHRYLNYDVHQGGTTGPQSTPEILTLHIDAPRDAQGRTFHQPSLRRNGASFSYATDTNYVSWKGFPCAEPYSYNRTISNLFNVQQFIGLGMVVDKFGDIVRPENVPRCGGYVTDWDDRINCIAGQADLNMHPTKELRDIIAGYFKGDVYEVIIYDRALSIEEMARVERYLQNSYNEPCPPVCAISQESMRVTVNPDTPDNCGDEVTVRANLGNAGNYDVIYTYTHNGQIIHVGPESSLRARARSGPNQFSVTATDINTCCEKSASAYVVNAPYDTGLPRVTGFDLSDPFNGRRNLTPQVSTGNRNLRLKVLLDGSVLAENLAPGSRLTVTQSGEYCAYVYDPSEPLCFSEPYCLEIFPAANLAVNASANPPVAQIGDNVTFSANALYASGSVSYRWRVLNDPSITLPSSGAFEFSFEDERVYEIEVEASDLLNAARDTIRLEVTERTVVQANKRNLEHLLRMPVNDEPLDNGVEITVYNPSDLAVEYRAVVSDAPNKRWPGESVIENNRVAYVIKPELDAYVRERFPNPYDTTQNFRLRVQGLSGSGAVVTDTVYDVHYYPKPRYLEADTLFRVTGYSVVDDNTIKLNVRNRRLAFRAPTQDFVDPQGKGMPGPAAKTLNMRENVIAEVDYNYQDGSPTFIKEFGTRQARLMTHSEVDSSIFYTRFAYQEGMEAWFDTTAFYDGQIDAGIKTDIRLKLQAFISSGDVPLYSYPPYLDVSIRATLGWALYSRILVDGALNSATLPLPTCKLETEAYIYTHGYAAITLNAEVLMGLVDAYMRASFDAEAFAGAQFNVSCFKAPEYGDYAGASASGTLAVGAEFFWGAFDWDDSWELFRVGTGDPLPVFIKEGIAVQGAGKRGKTSESLQYELPLLSARPQLSAVGDVSALAFIDADSEGQNKKQLNFIVRDHANGVESVSVPVQLDDNHRSLEDACLLSNGAKVMAATCVSPSRLGEIPVTAEEFFDYQVRSAQTQDIVVYLKDTTENAEVRKIAINDGGITDEKHAEGDAKIAESVVAPEYANVFFTRASEDITENAEFSTSIMLSRINKETGIPQDPIDITAMRYSSGLCMQPAPVSTYRDGRPTDMVYILRVDSAGAPASLVRVFCDNNCEEPGNYFALPIDPIDTEQGVEILEMTAASPVNPADSRYSHAVATIERKVVGDTIAEHRVVVRVYDQEFEPVEQLSESTGWDARKLYSELDLAINNDHVLLTYVQNELTGVDERFVDNGSWELESDTLEQMTEPDSAMRRFVRYWFAENEEWRERSQYNRALSSDAVDALDYKAVMTNSGDLLFASYESLTAEGVEAAYGQELMRDVKLNQLKEADKALIVRQARIAEDTLISSVSGPVYSKVTPEPAGIVVYPNPSDGLVKITAKRFSGNVTIQMYDLKGRRLYHHTAAHNNPFQHYSHAVDLRGVASSQVVNVVVADDHGNSASARIVLK